MSRNNDNEFLFWMGVAGLGLLGLFIYFQVKAFAEWLHLDWGSAAWMLTGFLALGVSVIVAVGKGWRLGKWFPWMLCGFYLFLLPALNWWSLNVPGRLMRFDNFEGTTAVQGSWYGNGWWQFVMFSILIAIAYGLNKLRDDRY